MRAYPASPSSAQQHKQGDLALQARNRCQGQLHFQGEPISPKLTAFLDSAGNEQWTQDLYSALKAFFEAQLPCMKEFIDRLPKPERRHSSHWSSRRAPKGLLPEGAAAGGGSQAGAGEANQAVLGQHEDLPVVVRVERPGVARFSDGRSASRRRRTPAPGCSDRARPDSSQALPRHAGERLPPR